MERRQAATRGPDGELDARIASFELAFRLQTEAPEMQDLAAGVDGDAAAVWARRPRDGRLRHAVPAGAAILGTGRPVRSVQSRRLGCPQQSEGRPRPTWPAPSTSPSPGCWPISNSAACGTTRSWSGEASSAARRPAKGPTAATTTPTDTRCGWPAAASRPGSPGARPTITATFAVEDKVHVHDLHATILHLLGLDHKRLTYRYAGRDFRLTDVHGELVDGILA